MFKNYFYFSVVFLLSISSNAFNTVLVSEVTCGTSMPARVLVYHETNGFRHGSIDEGINLIRDLGTANGLWTTDDSQTSDVFNGPNLDNYDVVVWCNTSGNNLLSAAEQQAFETWIKTDGNAFVGIHAATDTYRDGSWPFYNELVGAIVQTNPNHTSQNKVATMEVLQEHPSSDHLGDDWNKREEYYYWEINGGQLSPDNNNVLFVESTGGNSYDAPRPMAWYKTQITVNGETSDVRAFYTALGHRESDYTSDTNFESHIEGAIIWALAADETTFTNTGWTNGTPTVTMRAVIDADYDTATDGDMIARDLFISDGSTLEIAPGTTVLASENSTINGTLSIAHEGSFVQRDIAAVFEKGPTGVVEVHKTTKTIKPRDFMFMSSPMSAETRDGVYGNVENLTTTNVAPAFRVIYLNPENFQADPSVTSFPAYAGAETFLSVDNTFLGNYTATESIVPGEGLIVYPQASFAAGGLNTQYAITYAKGGCNTGNITFPVQYNGATIDNFNLLGNPYPSAIDINKFIASNPMVNEVYFWEHVTTPNTSLPGYLGQNPSMNDFSMRNLTTGMAAPNNPGETPSQFMASGQGFAIKADQSASGFSDVVFTNLMRVSGSNDQYRQTDENKEILWLRIDEETFGLQSATAIGFLEAASPRLDKGYDSMRLATPLSIYSVLSSGEELGIQGTFPFNLEQELKIGYATAIEKERKYTISLDAVQGENLSSAPIYLIDLLKRHYVDLREKSYAFFSNQINDSNRFVIRFQVPSKLDVQSYEAIAINVYPNPTSDVVFIDGKDLIKGAVLTIYDSRGAVLRKQTLDTPNAVVDVNALESGLYLFKINAGDVEHVRKVIIR